MSAAAEFSWVPPDSETELRATFDQAPVGLAQCQPRGEITMLNPALERMFSQSFRMGAIYFSDLIRTEDKSHGERLMRELFEGKRSSFQFDSRSLTANGTIVRWTGWLVLGPNRNADRALLLAQEIENEEIKDQEIQDRNAEPKSVDIKYQEPGQRLRQSQQLEAVGRLAGGVAHDFNNLLTGVILYSDLLMVTLDPSHPARKYAEEIRAAGIQATGLVRQLLAVARPAALGPLPLSLNEVVESIKNLLLCLIGENIRLEFRLNPDLGLIKIDRTQAQQILLNLVLNARDAMPAGGHICVETSNCRVQVLQEVATASNGTTSIPCVLFVVEDNGSGMDAATRAHAFEPFFTTKGGNGTGLGLSTVHDIVTSHGGLIHVDSSLGRGTRISLLLPLASNIEINSQTDLKLPERHEGVLPLIEKESTL